MFDGVGGPGHPDCGLLARFEGLLLGSLHKFRKRYAGGCSFRHPQPGRCRGS